MPPMRPMIFKTVPFQHACAEHVGRAFAGDGFRAFISKSAQIDAGHQILAGTQQHRPQGQMQFVDQARLQVLPHGGNATAQAHVAPACRGLRLVQCGLDAVGDEAELGAALHRQRRAGMLRQHEDRGVIRRLVAPPALPARRRARAHEPGRTCCGRESRRRSPRNPSRPLRCRRPSRRRPGPGHAWRARRGCERTTPSARVRRRPADCSGPGWARHRSRRWTWRSFGRGVWTSWFSRRFVSLGCGTRRLRGGESSSSRR